ncbi:MAG: GH13_26 / GH13 / GH13_20 / GH13_36 / GH13_30 [uncultured Friedmanniella sp.]|uniref:GH13_26 / GH13 / GH13_20 / GH13_36 / GH13_30 n=1 Tax=uncultured Friedmanniella sp. TaxID=335381 RepID=A0A6J4KQC5_9ACTN|nr:malto-oligosyltrehalose synthase [uncultured Friedmanniella sp.]CAA9311355.1 MAG: GH13_26 / GH13 / GH13_20 / GH13_36 / GH13_30 [uncultured Friedmanniella sp.]
MTPSVPTSTYRLQISRDFPLAEATALLDYLVDLGIGAVYLSPLLRSTTGSAHGYDTVDVTRIDPDRGGEPGLDALFAAAANAGLGVVIDIVPNHLGVEVPHENPAWWDVLQHGQQSAYADWFDIDWTRGRLLLPVLGDDAVLSVEDGELRYYEHRFPLAPGSWSDGEDAETVHARQHYELAHYSRGNTELNYRRFFAVTSLAGVRVEDQRVFDATHALVGQWVERGVAGLRVDHPDGLVDPGEYLRRLRALAPDQWITVEKILEPGEVLPADWPVEGTTGYDAMREVNGLFVDPSHEHELTALYQRLTGDTLTIAEHVEAGKRMVVTDLLPAEIRRMAALVPEVEDAPAAIAEVAVAFAVYRSYLPDGVADLDHAMALAVRRRPQLRDALEALSPRLHDGADELARRMQQLSGATMAKGTEDTAFYRYARFVALNEVGSDPAELGIDLDAFHAAQAARQSDQPRSMTGLSTHDTKRGEDVRARLAVLAEIPQAWGDFAEQFLSAVSIPNRAFAYFLAQTLVGAGPIERERMHAYAEKAMREASDGTTYTAVDEAYEATVHAAVDAAYDEPQLRTRWDDLVGSVTGPGWVNALGQKLVQLTMPGVPDVYQGTELWDDSLVDPDNRRPVDFVRRRSLLVDVQQSHPGVDDGGAAKLWVTRQALHARRDRPELFGGYTALHATGPAADHLVAFDRGGAVTLATRLPVGLAAAGGWLDTELELPGRYRDALTGRELAGRLKVAEVLDRYPVALLLRA